MLWVFAAACSLRDGDAPTSAHLSGSDDSAIDVDGDGYDASVDCDDDDASVHPGVDETCANARDDNCNGTADGCDWSGERELQGTELTTTEDSSMLGNTLALCDANGDGVDDVVVSAPSASNPGVYVFYGPIHDNRDVTEADYALMGDVGTYTGRSVDCRRDFDGDDVADIIVGEPSGSTGDAAGTVYVVPGGGTGRLFLGDEASTSWIGWDTDERLGYELVAIDADGDATDEIAVTPWHSNQGPNRFGIAYLFDDAGPGVHDVDAAVAYVYGEQLERIDVFTIGNAGDLDGDGVEELALAGQNDEIGAQLLVFGAPLVGPVSTADADIEIIGGPPDGVSWSGIGHADLDADGRDDLFVGNTSDNGYGGAVYAFLAPIAHRTNTDAAELRLLGPAFRPWGAGSDVTSAGDVDGDDIPDLLVGAQYGETVYLQYGGDRGVCQLEKTAQAWWASKWSRHAGATVAAGDVTGAGIVDLVIGSPGDGEKYEGSITIVPSWQL